MTAKRQPEPKPSKAKPARGGKRAGAGRKPTVENGIKSSLVLSATAWQRIDEHRGTLTRSAYIDQWARSLPPYGAD